MHLFKTKNKSKTLASDAVNIKLAFGIEYNGKSYFGWQCQKEHASLQACIERAISKVSDTPVKIFCAGRTDAGVHATGQVIHFETRSKRSNNNWTLGVNAHLPPDIAVRWAQTVPENFHARFSANARHYRYIIYNHRLRPAILNHGLIHYYCHKLDIDKMERAGQYLIGNNDFTSFRSLNCQSKTPIRNIHHLRVTKQGNYVLVDIKANSFVYHMVRIIVGSLIEVGCGNKPESWIGAILRSVNRSLAGATISAEGLYLVGVYYSAEFNLPDPPLGPLNFN